MPSGICGPVKLKQRKEELAVEDVSGSEAVVGGGSDVIEVDTSSSDVIAVAAGVVSASHTSLHDPV